MQQESVDRAALARLAEDAGVELPKAAVEPLAVYLELLTRWNRVMNLVGPHAWRDIFTRLVVDSLHLGPFLRRLPLPAAPLTWDLGAGAGLPGLPCGWSGLTGGIIWWKCAKSAPYFFPTPWRGWICPPHTFFAVRWNTFFRASAAGRLHCQPGLYALAGIAGPGARPAAAARRAGLPGAGARARPAARALALRGPAVLRGSGRRSLVLGAQPGQARLTGTGTCDMDSAAQSAQPPVPPTPCGEPLAARPDVQRPEVAAVPPPTASLPRFWLRGLFWGLVTLALAFGLRMLEWPCWQNPEYRLGEEWLLATHDAYHWVAGAEGFGRAVGHPMAVMLKALADLLHTYPAAVGFWFLRCCPVWWRLSSLPGSGPWAVWKRAWRPACSPPLRRAFWPAPCWATMIQIW